MSQEIYISYAWGDSKEEGESREAIVDQVYDQLTQLGLHILQDDGKNAIVNIFVIGNHQNFVHAVGRFKKIFANYQDDVARSAQSFLKSFDIAFIVHVFLVPKNMQAQLCQLCHIRRVYVPKFG